MPSPARIFAHRGHSGAAPENTLAAFAKAVECGADGVEFDVQLSRDGVPVVIHDESLERTAGVVGQVGEFSLESLQGLDAGGWFDPEFSGQRIPTLGEVLELLRPTPLQINIELKTNRLPYPGLVKKAVDTIEENGLGERVLLSSFNHHSLLEAQSLAPGLACAVLVSEWLIEPWSYVARHGFQALHPAHQTVTAEMAARCRDLGLALRPWTVDELEEARRLLGLGVDAIITNHPDRLLAWRGG